MAVNVARPGYELWRPNREKAESKTTKAVVALVLSWAPDIGLGLGGTAMQMSMRFVGPLTSIAEVLGLTGGGGAFFRMLLPS